MKVAAVKSRIVIAAVVAVVLTVCDYLLNNWPFPLLDDVDSLALKEYFLHTVADEEDDSVLYLNVAYDKALVDVTDDFGDTIGKTVITDRAVLTRLLSIAKDADYKYLVLDVRFEKGHETPSDSLLWNVLSQLPRFAFSAHHDQESGVPMQLLAASGLADYGATLSTGFTRWQYLQPEGVSLPLKIYASTDQSTIKRHGLFYTDSGRLCYNTIFLPLSIDELTPERQDGEVRYPLVGGDLFRLNSDEEIREMMRDKVVIIGDFENDVHDTYIGDVPGPALIYHAYKQLHEGRHIVKWGYIIFMLSLFFIIAYCILSSGSLFDSLPYFNRHPLMKTLLSFISWEIILSVVQLVMYVTMSWNFNTFIPAITFAAMGWINTCSVFTWVDKISEELRIKKPRDN